ncbi:MAG: hypothetical protein BZY82_03125 [SAR202 cluster bacterium Io17-Chloro-G3]|nr:MAG: hypothetical protein BZY82_03125 [SAR202 cluster bacterium Io17-Chloro-G3]
MARRQQREVQNEGQLSGTAATSLLRSLSRARGSSAIIAIAGVVALVLGIAMLLLSGDLGGTAYTTLSVSGVLLLLALLISFNTVVQSITGRRGRYGVNTGIMIVSLVVLVGLVDTIAVRNTWDYDTTATKQFSLADQTVDILKDLPEPVEAIAFFDPKNIEQLQISQDVEDLLAEFARRSSRFEYTIVDPDLDPTTAKRYGIRQYPTVAFVGTESERLHQVVSRFQERDFATALLIATGVERKTLYVLTGHGEREASDFEPGSAGFGFAVEGLSGDNYGLTTLSLLENPNIPENAAAIIIAGPTKELEDAESEELQRYLEDGGRAIVLLDPNPPESFIQLLGKWGVLVNDGLLLDMGSYVANQEQTPLITRDQYFNVIPSITEDLEESFLPGSTGFDYPGLHNLPGFETSFDPEKDPIPETISYTPIAGTTLLSCSNPDLDSPICDRFGGSQLPALAFVGIAPLNKEPDPDASQQTAVVLFGDSDFASNKYFYSRGNSDLFLNSVNWLTEDISLSAARPKPRAFRLLVLTRPEMRFVQYSSWLLLPLGVLLLGGIAWWRRR